MLQGKVKKILVSVIVGVLLIVSPFSVALAENNDYVDPTYMACRQFFSKYMSSVLEDTEQYIHMTNDTEGYTTNAWNYNAMQPAVGGSWLNPTSYTTSNRQRLTKEPLYIIFMSTTNFTSANVSIYPQSGYTASITRVTNDNLTVDSPSGYYFIVLKAQALTVPSAGNIWASIGLPGTSTTKIIPIFYGTELVMPDNLYRFVFGKGRSLDISDEQTHTLLNTINVNSVNIRTLLSMNNEMLSRLADGNTSSASSSTQLTQQATQLDTGVTQYNQLEDSFNSNFSADFNNIDFNNSLTSNSSLLSSMSWVRTQYDRMTSNNVFGTFIQYALLFGLGLMVIGLL